MTIYIAPYPKALRRFTIKVKNENDNQTYSFIKITLKKISFKITLKSVKIYTTFYGFRSVIPQVRCRDAITIRFQLGARNH